MQCKKANSFDYSGGFKFIKFTSGGTRTEVSAVEDDQDNHVNDPSWIEYYQKMKQKKPFTRGGIGHTNIEFTNLELLDSHSLTTELEKLS